MSLSAGYVVGRSVSADGTDVSGEICSDGVRVLASAAEPAALLLAVGLFHIFAYTPIRWGYSVDIPPRGISIYNFIYHSYTI